MRNSFTNRRGVAMLLVLISLAVATIATSAYIASRDNSALIGENAMASCVARATAVSGLELGIAILETESDWRQSHTDGRLLDGYRLDGGDLDIDLVDMVTGMPPTEETMVVEMTATARFRGIQQRAVAVATVLGGEEGRSIDVDLSEFGVFAGEKLRMENDATITRWTTSPLAGLGNAINVGTQADTAGTIELIGNAAAIDTTVFTGPTPSGSLVQNATGPAIGIQSLSNVIPMPDPPTPPQAAPTGSQPNVDVNGSTATISTGPVYEASMLKVRQGGELTLSGDFDVVCTSLWIEQGSRLLIDGNVNVIVYGEFWMDGGSSIELLPDATLDLYVEGALTLTDSYIGDSPFDPATDLDTTGSARWMDPQRVTIYSMPTTSEWTQWKVSGESVLKGRLYAKNFMYLELRHTAAFYGNVVANQVRVLEQAAIFYDHTLDGGNGYTRADSNCFDDFGNILEQLLGLTSLDAEDLQEVADRANVSITANGQTIESSQGDAGPEPEPSPTPVTPRPIRVDYVVESIGAPVHEWESSVQ